MRRARVKENGKESKTKIKVRAKVELREDSESERKRCKESETKRIARVKESSKRRTFLLRAEDFARKRRKKDFAFGGKERCHLLGFAASHRRAAAKPHRQSHENMIN